MDSTEPPYSQARFEEIQKEVSGLHQEGRIQPSCCSIRPHLRLARRQHVADQRQTCPGTRDGTLSARKARPVVPLCSKLLIPSSRQRDLQTSLLGFPFRMSTKLEVLEQCQWAVSRLE